MIISANSIITISVMDPCLTRNNLGSYFMIPDEQGIFLIENKLPYNLCVIHCHRLTLCFF